MTYDNTALRERPAGHPAGHRHDREPTAAIVRQFNIGQASARSGTCAQPPTATC